MRSERSPVRFNAPSSSPTGSPQRLRRLEPAPASPFSDAPSSPKRAPVRFSRVELPEGVAPLAPVSSPSRSSPQRRRREPVGSPSMSPNRAPLYSSRAVDPTDDRYLLPSRREQGSRSVSPFRKTHTPGDWLEASVLRDADMSTHFEAKYGSIEAREYEAERRARSASREWHGISKSPDANRRFTAGRPVAKQDPDMPKRVGMKQWAHITNRMLVSLLDELDTECQERMEVWIQERDQMEQKVEYLKEMFKNMHSGLYRTQQKEIAQSEAFQKRTVFNKWVCEAIDRDRQRRLMKSFNVRHRSYLDVLVEKCFNALSSTRARRMSYELLAPVIDPQYQALVSKDSKMPLEVVPAFDYPKIVVSQATGVGESCNGVYELQDIWNGRPRYLSDTGAAIYWVGKWRMRPPPNEIDNRYMFSVPNSHGSNPPLGQWTTQGYDESLASAEHEYPSPPMVEVNPELLNGADNASFNATKKLQDALEHPEDAHMKIVKVPRNGLLQHRHGKLFTMRAVMMVWKAAQMSTQADKQHASSLTVPEDHIGVRSRVIEGWLKRAHVRATRERVVGSVARAADSVTKRQIFIRWLTYTLRSFHARNLVVCAKEQVRGQDLAGCCFLEWKKSAWDERTHRQVQEKIEALEATMETRNKIWGLRVTELSGALAQAKRAQHAPADQQAKSQYAFRKWQLSQQSTGFFRMPKVAADTPNANRSRTLH